MILTVASGCDNVAWGGAEVRWVRPDSAAAAPADDPGGPQVGGPTEVPRPLLLAGERDGGRATLVVVGQIGEGGLAPATDTSTAVGVTPGSEWILFSEGARVGRMTADDMGMSQDYCPWRATLAGTVELVAAASRVERFLALPAAQASTFPYDSIRTFTSSYEQRVATLTLAQEAIPRLGAQWPEGGVLPTRQDLQVFQPAGSALPTVAGTYLYRDRLEVGDPSRGAYALFLLATVEGERSDGAYEWYQAADSAGKRAPRYFAHLDWNGDGRGEILLDVFGSNARWHASLEQRDGRWVRSFEHDCGAGASPVG